MLKPLFEAWCPSKRSLFRGKESFILKTKWHSCTYDAKKDVIFHCFAKLKILNSEAVTSKATELRAKRAENIQCLEITLRSRGK